MHEEDLAKLIGARRVIKDRVRTADWLRNRIRAGLPFSTVRALANRIDVPTSSVGDALHIPAYRLVRRRRTRRLTPGESDRLVRAGRIVAMVEETLGDRRKAARWLRKPNRALGGVVPLYQLDTDIGAQEVETILGRVAHGVYS